MVSSMICQPTPIFRCECALFAIDNWVGRRAFGLLQELEGTDLKDCTDDNLLVCQQFCASAALRWSEKNNLNTQVRKNEILKMKKS